MRAIKVLAVVYLLVTAFGLVLWRVTARSAPTDLVFQYEAGAPLDDARTPNDWFNTVRPHCTTDEVRGQMEARPPMPGHEGSAYAAACWALAGYADETREAILAGEPMAAAELVFGVIHPEADAGREAEMAAGMEVVLEFRPTHPMALYHAGSAAYSDARFDAARDYLERFLEVYPAEDGWRSNARSMLETLS